MEIDYNKVILVLPYIWIWLLIIIIIWLLFNNKNYSIEELRLINLKEATELKKINEKQRLQLNEVARSLEKKRSDIDWCITNNSTKWIAWECFIFNNK